MPSVALLPHKSRTLPIDWPAVAASLDAEGHAVLPSLLSASECTDLAALYPQRAQFRSRMVMARHGFGRGEYQYFAYPLPPLIEQLRHALYPPLAQIANGWNQRLGVANRYPGELPEFLACCHAAEQRRPTPLLLQYGAGDYNCLHQDLYGELVFPLQVAALLSVPGHDFAGGEFVVTERIGTAQRANVVPLHQGDAVVFTVNERPVPGQRGGMRRAAMRHGVSQVRSGHRHTLGLIFHDAR